MEEDKKSEVMKRKTAWRKKLLIVVGIAFLYWNAGYLYMGWLNYARQYCTSTAAKILTPAPPFVAMSPFSEQTPKIDTKHTKFSGVLSVLIWPILVLTIYVLCLFLWIVQLAMWFWCWFWGVLIFLYKFFIDGGMLYFLKLTP